MPGCYCCAAALHTHHHPSTTSHMQIPTQPHSQASTDWGPLDGLVIATTAGSSKKQRRRGQSQQQQHSQQSQQSPASTSTSTTNSTSKVPSSPPSPPASSVIAPEEGTPRTPQQRPERTGQPHRHQQHQQQQPQAAAAAAGTDGGPGEMERGGRGRALALLLLLLSSLSLLAALEYQSGGWATQGLFAFLAQKGGGGDDGSSCEDLLMISGGAAKGATAAAAGAAGEALVVRPEGAVAASGEARRRGAKGKKRAALANAGKAVFKALGLPIRTVLGGLRKLLSIAKGEGWHGRRKGGQGQQGQQQAAIGHGGGQSRYHRPITFVDLDALAPEERRLVEETYEDLLARPGLVARAAAVGMEVDRECVARYFIAAQWKKPAAHALSMADNVARTVRWREEERVAVLGPADVARQAANGYLYVNGTDREARPVIYYRPADQGTKAPEEAIRYLVYTLERALAAGRAASGVEAYSFIIDCSGFSLQNMPPVHLIKQAFQLLHHHYPTRVGFICMLYTGSAFQLLWKIISPLVSPMTRGKITFAPTGQEARELLARIPPDQLETRFGGEREFAFAVPAYFGISAEEAARIVAGGAPSTTSGTAKAA